MHVIYVNVECDIQHSGQAVCAQGALGERINTIAFNPGKEHQTLLYYPLQYVRMYGICGVLSEEQMLLYSTSNSLNVASHSLNTATHTLNVMSHSLSQM